MKFASLNAWLEIDDKLSFMYNMTVVVTMVILWF